MNIKVFNYIEELDAFVPTQRFKSIVEKLGLTEWTHVVFICRLLAMDNDYGEHIFDNWDEREALTEKVEQLGKEKCRELGMNVETSFDIAQRFGDATGKESKEDWASSATESLLIVVPDSFMDGKDGPCHSDKVRKMFWTDMCKNMQLSLDFLFEAARENAKDEFERDSAAGRLYLYGGYKGDIPVVAVEKAIEEIKEGKYD